MSVTALSASVDKTDGQSAVPLQTGRTILHIDMNNFYASVECQRDPALRAFPVAVCGDSEERHGIVLAKNDIAKKRGVRTGQAVWEAKQYCPGLQVIKPHFDAYVRVSRLARRIYADYTDKIEPFGLDEVWADVTENCSRYGGGEKLANCIRERIKQELGVTVSVGVSFNKVFAKLASDMKKPDAVTVIPPAQFREIVWKLPASDLIGVGRSTTRALASVGIFTVGQLAQFPVEYLKRRLGKCGIDLWLFANGRDNSPVLAVPDKVPLMWDLDADSDKSVGHGITTIRDMENGEEVWKVMLELCEEIGHRLLLGGKRAKGVAIMTRDSALDIRMWQMQLSYPASGAGEIARAAFALFKENYAWLRPLRSITVRAIQLVPDDEPFQIDIFCDMERRVRWEKIDKAVDFVRTRFGVQALCRASVLELNILPGRQNASAAGEKIGGVTRV